MTIRNALAFSLAAAFLSVAVVGAADAATMHRRMTHKPHMMHGSSHHAMPMDADHSADQLNAQSLAKPAQ